MIKMSFFHHPDETGAPDLHIWKNNAAFDNEEYHVSATVKPLSLLTNCSKENSCPLLLKTPASVKYPVPVKPLNPIGVIGNSLRTPAKISAKDEVIGKERNIDSEIEETEKEISRLSTRLKSLQIEKAEQNGRTIQRRKINDRGESLGPSEICVPGTKSRRKSCFPKIRDMDEDNVMKRRGMSVSISSKSLSKVQGLKQPATIAVSKRSVKKDGIFEFIQPKRLFKDVEKSVPDSAKKPLRAGAGRIVASRYNQTNESSAVAIESRKRSLPGTCKDDGGRYDKRRASSELSRSKGPGSRMKKRWEIPTEKVVYQQEVEEKYASSVANVSDMLLPKIRTIRYATSSPRDSGPAKRVAELHDSRRNIFVAGEIEASICQELNFTEDDEEE